MKFREEMNKLKLLAFLSPLLACLIQVRPRKEKLCHRGREKREAEDEGNYGSQIRREHKNFFMSVISCATEVKSFSSLWAESFPFSFPSWSKKKNVTRYVINQTLSLCIFFLVLVVCLLLRLFYSLSHASCLSTWLGRRASLCFDNDDDIEMILFLLSGIIEGKKIGRKEVERMKWSLNYLNFPVPEVE